MGGVELLSREGEIAIAKRIEAGKNSMSSALAQSPIIAKKIFEWKEKIENEELLVREIIDIDSTYVDIDESETTTSSPSKKNKKIAKDKYEDNKVGKVNNEKDEATGTEDEEDEFNVSLAAMESEIRPKVILTLTSLEKNYAKLTKYQRDKLENILQDKDLSKTRERSYKKIQDLIVEEIKILQLSPSILEELVQQHYSENKKIHLLKFGFFVLA
jgi:RNA polymerase primary sigma factor